MGVFGCLGYHFKARKNLYEGPPLLYEGPPLATEWDTLEDFDRLCAGKRVSRCDTTVLGHGGDTKPTSGRKWWGQQMC